MKEVKLTSSSVSFTLHDAKQLFSQFMFETSHGCSKVLVFFFFLLIISFYIYYMKRCQTRLLLCTDPAFTSLFRRVVSVEGFDVTQPTPPILSSVLTLPYNPTRAPEWRSNTYLRLPSALSKRARLRGPKTCPGTQPSAAGDWLLAGR